MSDVRERVLAIGRRWSVSLVELVTLALELDESGTWALDGSPTCSHWIASALEVEVGTARGWLRVGHALRDLPLVRAAFVAGEVSFSKVRLLVKLATAANEAELLELAKGTPVGGLGVVLARWSARHEDDDTRDGRHRRERSLRWATTPDGMVQVSGLLTPEQAAKVTAAVDAEVMRGDGREPVVVTEGGGGVTGSREPRGEWSSLAQQRVDALVRLVTGGGANVSTEVILHVRADGCSLDDGTPISGSVVERIAEGAVLRAMIHDAESHPINVSGRHRHFTARQKRVIHERDRACVDCGSREFLEYDHVPDFEITKRTLVDEGRCRCGRCHRARHREAAASSRA